MTSRPATLFGLVALAMGPLTGLAMDESSSPLGGTPFSDGFEDLVTSGLVINEVDYDQPGVDAAEFVEIYNTSATPVNLSQLALVLVNGADSLEYDRFELSVAGADLPANAYLVVGNQAVLAALPGGTLSLLLNDSTLQNGPDGVALVDVVTMELIDALSYEGAITAAVINGFDDPVSLVEGTASTAEDSSAEAGSMSRIPNGSDTDDADSDWQFTTSLTPGAANVADLGCVDDGFEDNDDFINAAEVFPPVSDLALQICSGDDDYFAFLALAGDMIQIFVAFTHAVGDLDLTLYDDEGTPVSNSTSLTDNESIDYTVPAGEEGTYILQVEGVAGAENDYVLSIVLQ